MRWIYLSPHFDDVVLSCGGLAWEQVKLGLPVEVWTICAGEPDPGEPVSAFAQQLHERWGTGPEAVPARNAEDQKAVKLLGAGLRSWTLPDCIYRRLPDGTWLINGEEDLWRPVHPQEAGVVEQLSEWIANGLREYDLKDLNLVSPLTLGNHVDHFLVRAAAERVARQRNVSLWYYPDYPYAVGPRGDLAGKIGEHWQQVCWPVSREALSVWQDAVASYASQISTFWDGRAGLDAALETYWQAGGGACLWQPG